MVKNVTIDELATIPQERRRYGWVVVCMVRSSARRGRRTWNALHVIGFFPGYDDAIAFVGAVTQRAGYKYDVCPFEDGNPIGMPEPFKPS